MPMLLCDLCRKPESISDMAQTKDHDHVCRRCRMPGRLQSLWDTMQQAELDVIDGREGSMQRLRFARANFELAKHPRSKVRAEPNR